jgi:Fis family transcriptional regulator, factor for inversion stimulation protein
VLCEVELPLLNCVLRHTAQNQSQTAQILGLNRGTLRKKMKKYGLL